MRKTATATIAGICCASALLAGAFMTGCADNKNTNEANNESANETVIVEETQNDAIDNENGSAEDENTEVAEVTDGNEIIESASSTNSQFIPAGEQVTFTWHPQGGDLSTYDPDERGDVEQQHRKIICISNGDGSFSFTTYKGNRLTATFTDEYIPALDEYDVSIVNEEGIKVIMPSNGGGWLLLDGNEHINATFL